VRRQEVAAVPEGLDVDLFDALAAGVLDQFAPSGMGQAAEPQVAWSPRCCDEGILGGLVPVGLGAGLDQCADPVGDSRAQAGLAEGLVPLGERVRRDRSFLKGTPHRDHQWR
jgi:hypothetical protein